MEFFCVYCKTRKKVDKFIKVNRIKNKYIIDIKKIMEEEEVSFADDKMYLKVLIFQKIQQAIDKKKEKEDDKEVDEGATPSKKFIKIK